MKEPIVNILSFDVEDWNQGFVKRGMSGWENFDYSEEKNIKMILELLSEHKTRATFFILGNYAEKNKGIIKEIHSAGHEIASHSYAHKVITDLTPDKFREDLYKSKAILSDIIGEDILGFRAPKWSVNRRSLWIFRALAEEGFKYDSSIFPSPLHEFGSSEFSCRPYKISGNDFTLYEFPAGILKVSMLRIPAAGGFYLRAMPYFLSKYALKKSIKKNNYGMVYLHPFEFDAEVPVIKSGLLFRFVRYYNLGKTLPFFKLLLNDFNFTDIKSVVSVKDYNNWPEISFET